MALSLKSLRKVRSVDPPRVLIYGPPGLGKTTLAAEFPNAVFLQFEDGTPAGLEVDSWGKLNSYNEAIEAMGALYGEKHEHQTLVVDSLDKMEPHVWRAVCEGKNWDSIESPGYGKGYVEADQTWRDFIDGCNALRTERKMSIVLIAHSDVNRFDDPRTQSYSQFDIRLHKRALAIIKDEMDLICFVNHDATIKMEDQGFNRKRGHAEGGMTRWLYVEGRPSVNAKNRFGMPPKIPFVKGQGYAKLAPYFPHLNGGVIPAEPKPEPAADQAAA